MRIKFSVLILSFLITVSVNAEIYKQLKVYDIDKETAKKLSQYDIVGYGDEYLEIIVNRKEYAELLKLGLPIDVIHEDLSNFYQSRYPAGTTMGGFRTYSEVVAVLDSLALFNPYLITAKSSIGQTIEGRDLWMVKISDNPGIDEDEPEIFIDGMHHAREPITSEVCIEFMIELLDNYGSDPTITNLVNNNEFYFVPIVNPDGYEYNFQTNPDGGGMWRKNRRLNDDDTYGVDLNRNYPYFWGYDGNGSSPYTWSQTYRGTGPASEPEVQHLMQFTMAHDFAWIMNFHSYSNMLLWPWGYYDERNPDHYEYWELFGDYAEDSLDYDAGPSWQVIYNTNGDANDWGYGEQGIKRKTYAMTIEIGDNSDGFWPTLQRIPVLIAENVQALINYSNQAYEIYKRRAPSMPEIISPGIAPADRNFYIHWHTSDIDTFNTAVSYRVTEKSGYERITLDCEATRYFQFNNFTRSSNRQHSGIYSIYSGQGDNYRAFAILEEKILVQPGDTLSFWIWYNIETDWDYAYIEASDDGGLSWRILYGNQSSETNPNNHNQGHGITGNSNGWVLAKYYLDDYVDRQIDIRFSYWTDGSVNNEGIYFDDIYPYDELPWESILSEYVSSDSFEVGPYPPGIYYFQVTARDDRGDLSPISSRFMVQVIEDYDTTQVEFIPGDANGDSLVIGSDVTYLINYLRGVVGPPEPFLAGDANGDCLVIGSDVTYLVNYFRGAGNPPVYGDCPSVTNYKGKYCRRLN